MKKKLLILIFSIVFCLSVFTGCKKGGVYLTGGIGAGYKEIKTVQGVSFAVPNSLTATATAITEINNNVSFSYSNVYSYKDGQSNYLLFNMSSYVIIVSNNVHYDIKGTNKEEIVTGLTDYYMLGLRVNADKDSIQYESTKKNGVTKIIAKVDAELILTTEFYNNFCGKIAYITDGTNEYALFIGAAVENYSEIKEDSKKIIDYVTKSFKLKDKEPNMQENIVPDNNKEPDDKTEEPVQKPGDVDTTDKEDTVDKVPDADMEEPKVEGPEEKPNEKENEEIKDNDKEPEETVTPETDPEKPDIKEDDEITYPIEEQPVATGQGINISNQSQIKNNRVNYSTIYSMLNIGQSGYMSVYNNPTQKSEEAAITAERIYIGEAAENIIKEHCMSADAIYEYTEPSVGTSWNVLEYSVDFNNIDLENNKLIPYVNIKILGMDGERLNFRGVTYSKKTHDIKSFTDKNGSKVSKCYVFYEVPNGCTEYLIEAGDGTIDTMEYGILSAYYKVNIQDLQR